MGIKYDPNAFETWRPNFEMHQALAGFAACAYCFIYDDLFGSLGFYSLTSVLWCAGLGLYAFNKGIRRYRMTLRLAGTPLPFIDFEGLKAIVDDPIHRQDMWLGRGFPWGQTQVQRVYNLLKRDWHRIYREALGSVYLANFVKKHFWLCLFRPLTAIHNYREIQKRVSEAQGQTWIHGVGDGEEDLFQPVSHSEGHTLIIGTTGSGKTRCFDLLISQAVLRNETIFIIDPKGDKDLRDKARRACEVLGRGHKFLSFHPAFPEESIKINLLANWTRPSEIADRIASLIPSASDSDPFKNFAFGALNAICTALCSIYQEPNLRNLKHYLAGTSGNAVADLTIKVIDHYLQRIFANDQTQLLALQTKIQTLRHKDLESVAIAYIEFYHANAPMDADVDDLVSMFTHNKEHFGKMITSLLPILSMLTSGTLGDMLSPSESEEARTSNVWLNTDELIAKNHVVYVGLDSLSDPMVGSAIGALFLSDLACVAGARYNFAGTEGKISDSESQTPPGACKSMMSSVKSALGFQVGNEKSESGRTVNIFVDEAAEVVNGPFLQILNKGRGARLKLFVATQTFSDFVARMGSRDKANQLLGNLNNKICLRCIDPETQKFVTDSMPKTKVMSVQRTQGLSTTVHEPVPRGGSLSERLAEEEVPLVSPELLSMLPNLEFFASLSGGHIIKGRYPLIVKDISEVRR